MEPVVEHGAAAGGGGPQRQEQSDASGVHAPPVHLQPPHDASPSPSPSPPTGCADGATQERDEVELGHGPSPRAGSPQSAASSERSCSSRSSDGGGGRRTQAPRVEFASDRGGTIKASPAFGSPSPPPPRQPQSEQQQVRLQVRVPSPCGTGTTASDDEHRHADAMGTERHERQSSSSSFEANVTPMARVASAAHMRIKNFLNPTYRKRNEQFRKLFPSVPETDKLVIDYSCALMKDMLVHGRLYLTQQQLCFHANIFKWETTVCFPYHQIAHVTKERTAVIIPNAIQVETKPGAKHFFTSFARRDKAYQMLFRLWQYCLMNKSVNIAEMWSLAGVGANYDTGDLSPAEDANDHGFAADADGRYDDCDGGAARRADMSGLAQSQPVLLDGSSSASDGRESSQNLSVSADSYNTGAAGSPVDFAAALHCPMSRSDQAASSSSVASERRPHSVCVDGSAPSDADAQPHAAVQLGIVVQQESAADERHACTAAVDSKDHSLPAATSECTTLKRDMHAPSQAFLSPDSVASSGGAFHMSRSTPMLFNVHAHPTDDTEQSCSCSSHTGKELLNCTYGYNSSDMFHLLYSDNQFFRDFEAKRKIVDLDIGDWEADESQPGHSRRVFKYTMHLAQTLGPKYCYCTETQHCAQMGTKLLSAPVYVLRCVIMNAGVPYCDHFSVHTTICITPANNSGTKARLRVHGGVEYKKSMWGLVRGIVEKSSMSGLEEYYKALDASLRQSGDALSPPPLALRSNGIGKLHIRLGADEWPAARSGEQRRPDGGKSSARGGHSKEHSAPAGPAGANRRRRLSAQVSSPLGTGQQHRVNRRHIDRYNAVPTGFFDMYASASVKAFAIFMVLTVLVNSALLWQIWTTERLLTATLARHQHTAPQSGTLGDYTKDIDRLTWILIDRFDELRPGDMAASLALRRAREALADAQRVMGGLSERLAELQRSVDKPAVGGDRAEL